ncbi:MAG: hypothetical protein RR131_06080 [Anaerovorax sp.]
MDKFVPRCSRRTLLLLAGLVWMVAGSMVTRFGFQVFVETTVHRWIFIATAPVVFFVFYHLVFKKMVYKHQKRIASMTKEKVCTFSFFDKKSYLIMAFMMSAGIFIRCIPTINPLCWAPFYMGLGLALLGAGILFMMGWFTWAL